MLKVWFFGVVRLCLCGFLFLRDLLGDILFVYECFLSLDELEIGIGLGVC